MSYLLGVKEVQAGSPDVLKITSSFVNGIDDEPARQIGRSLWPMELETNLKKH